MGNLRLSASIRSWDQAEDDKMYAALQRMGYAGLEMDPERVFPEDTYAHQTGAALFAGYLYQSFGLQVSALSPVLDGFGRAAADAQEAEWLESVVGGVCRFGASCRCNTLVMPCTTLPEERFLQTCGFLTAQYQCTLLLEPQAGLSVRDTCRFVKQQGVPGVAVSLNVATLLANGETMTDLVEYLPQIGHVRICEPDGGAIQPHGVHRELALLLGGLGYQGWVSAEMASQEPQQALDALQHVADTFSAVSVY